MRTLMTEELVRVVGGTDGKCNNGWGNGAEGVQYCHGSTVGATAESKWDEHWEEGDGPAPAKFDLR